MTPLVQVKPEGAIRSFVGRLRDRHQLAGLDIRRHLRVQPAENSLDSAGL
jgi:nucleoside diphosphate kinase